MCRYAKIPNEPKPSVDTPVVVPPPAVAAKENSEKPKKKRRRKDHPVPEKNVRVSSSDSSSSSSSSSSESDTDARTSKLAALQEQVGTDVILFINYHGLLQLIFICVRCKQVYGGLDIL